MDYFEINDFVKITSDNDNENYNEFKNKKLKIVKIATNTNEHKGYDECMKGMPLYDLIDVDTNKYVDFSLYHYELESF